MKKIEKVIDKLNIARYALTNERTNEHIFVCKKQKGGSFLISDTFLFLYLLMEGGINI